MRIEGKQEDQRRRRNISPHDLKGQDYEVHLDLLPDNTLIGDGMVRNSLGLNSLMARKGMIDGGEQITRHTAPSIESEENDRRTYIYTDESALLDCEMPELVVFLQESKYQAIKDFCTDGEVPLHAKSLTENCGLDHNIVSCLLNSDADSSELPKERQSTQSSISNSSNSFIQHDCNDYVVEQCGSRDLEKKIEIDFDARDRVSIEGYTGRITPETQCLVGEAGSNCYHFELSNPIGHGCGQKCYQGSSEEAVLANSLLYPAPEEISSRRHAIEASFRSEIKSESIPLDIDSSIATISSREKEPRVVDCQQHFETENLFRLDDGASESLTVSTQSLVIQNGHEESSFSTPGPLSNSIAFSGPISYSGSMSLRSNSSTRSFAFPILQSEWNGSPVKMIEPDRRHSRKCRPWRLHYLCCKF